MNTKAFAEWATRHGWIVTTAHGVVVGIKRGGRARRVWQYNGRHWAIVAKKGPVMLGPDDKE